MEPTALTAHITAGHTRGCTSWSCPVRDGTRVLNVVSVCDPGVMSTMRHPEQAADRYRKGLASTAAKSPVDAFIDPDGYRAYIDRAEADPSQLAHALGAQ